MGITLTDVIILIVLLSIIISLIYFNIYKHRKEPCYSCGSKSKCSSKGNELRNYYSKLYKKELKTK